MRNVPCRENSPKNSNRYKMPDMLFDCKALRWQTERFLSDPSQINASPMHSHRSLADSVVREERQLVFMLGTHQEPLDVSGPLQ